MNRPTRSHTNPEPLTLVSNPNLDHNTGNTPTVTVDGNGNGNEIKKTTVKRKKKTIPKASLLLNSTDI